MALLQIAKVLKSNGTDGGVLFGFRSIDPQDIDLKEPVFIEFDGLPVPFFIESLSAKGASKAVAHITDVSSLKDAEEIVGREVFADYFEEDEDGPGDFSGWTLYDTAGEGGARLVGTVDSLEPIPGNPCLSVAGALVPLHEDLVEKVDKERRHLFLRLPEGLLDR